MRGMFMHSWLADLGMRCCSAVDVNEAPKSVILSLYTALMGLAVFPPYVASANQSTRRSSRLV